MKRGVKAVVVSALKLPQQDRVDVARQIISSLDEEDPTEIDAAWKAEIGRRLRKIQERKVKLKSADEVLRALKQKYQP